MYKHRFINLVKQEAVSKIKKAPLLFNLSLIFVKSILTYIFYILFNLLKILFHLVNLKKIKELYEM